MLFRSCLESLQPANNMALTKKKKLTRKERNAQKEEREAAAEAACEGFFGGSSPGVGAFGSAGGPSGTARGQSGSAGGDNEFEEQ